jgi:golgi phosphoprotein 3
MEFSFAKQFLILALNPEKGRVSISSIHFRYTLTGSFLMDYLDNGEISISNKRIIPSFRINTDAIHTMIGDRISASSRNRRISYWISRLTNKSRFIMNNLTLALQQERLLTIEQKKFLGIFPYKRYWLIDKGLRSGIIETMRGILIHGKQPEKREMMFLGLIEASRSYKLLSRESGEARRMRKRNIELLKGDIISAEINQAIREVQAAVAASVMAATMASSGAH